MKRLITLTLAAILSFSVITQIKNSINAPTALPLIDSAPATPTGDELASPEEQAEIAAASTQSEPKGLKAVVPYLIPMISQEQPDSFDRAAEVRLLSDGQVVTLSLRDYIIGVVAAEMPASFEAEALKAQAVASRSCTLYNITHSSTHDEADICSQSSCCQAYATQERMHEKWGDRYEQYYDIIAAAVDATDGICLFYDGELIYAPYHSSSYAATESSGQIWSDKPYLVSVASPESPDDIPNFTATRTVSNEEFIRCLSASYPVSTFDSGLVISDISLAQSGRVDTVTVNDITLSGSKLRSLFSLRSTNMEIEQDGHSITFTTYGWGHGVGMSQYGADAMAAQGAGYEEILKWYYTGVELAVPVR